jgi:prevent-host-death family protein
VEVTARELKLRLGKYLSAVRCGETVRVSHRGKVVAELTPPALTANDKLARLIAQGRVAPGNGQKMRPFTPLPAGPGPTPSEIILADREERL